MYGFIYVQYWKMQTNLWGQKSDQWLPGAWDGADGWGRFQRKLFRGLFMFLILIVVIVKLLPKFVKIHRIVYLEGYSSM